MAPTTILSFENKIAIINITIVFFEIETQIALV